MAISDNRIEMFNIENKISWIESYFKKVPEKIPGKEVVPDILPIKKHRIITVTARGRKRYLSILARYLLKNRPLIDEAHLWINTINKDDIDYIYSLEDKYPGFFKAIVSKKIPDGIATTPHFFSNCTEVEAIYIKLDDDICFIEDNAIQNIVNCRIKNENAIFIAANCVNMTYPSYLHKTLCGMYLNIPLTQNLICNYGWKSGRVAEKMHNLFLENYSKKQLNNYMFNDIELPI